MGAEKTCCSLVVDLALSRPTDGKRGGGGPCTALSPGLRSGGLESKFGRGPGHLGLEGDGLVLLVTSGACVFGAPSWAHWFANRREIRYGLFTV